MNTENNFAYLLALISAAINETQPPEPDGEIDFSFICKAAQLHGMANTAFYAVEKLRTKPDAQLMKNWRDERNKLVHRNMIQRLEMDAVTDAFDREGIEYMPFKGFEICSLYPQSDYRYMSDLDILIKGDLKRAGDIVLRSGYTVKRSGTNHDDCYVKPPFMMLELHSALVGLGSPYRAYYDDIFDRTKKVGTLRQMSGEDIYIYMIAHMEKHYASDGTGIRSVADVYLFNKKRISRLDRAYIDDELKKLGLTDFHREIKGIAYKWFEREDYDSFSDKEMYILKSGIFGTEKQKMLNRRGNDSSVRFLKRRLLPPSGLMKEWFPVLRRAPFLLPIFYIYRILRGIFKKRDKIKEEIEIINANKRAEK